MRRGTDRLQTITRAVSIAVFLIGVPAGGAVAGHAIYLSGLRAERAQAAAWRGVPAVVLRVTPLVAGWYRSSPPPAWLSVRWTSPAWSARTGETMGTVNVVPDSTVTVWIDGQGPLTHPPLSHADVISRAIAAGVAAAVAFALLLAAILRAESLARDKRRLARWEAEWSAVEPQWTRRR
jgi:hypothetical protein